MLSPVDEIKSRLDIVDIVQEYVPLKVAGVNMKGLCPFHREKTPSFTVHKGRQMWHCFGCQQGGDMFTFIEKIENVEFPEALEILAKKANIELRKEDPRLQSERQRMRELLAAAAQWFADTLKGPHGAEALKYLKEKRGLHDGTIDAWQLGFAPEAWEELVRFLRVKGFRDQEMVAAGVALPGKTRAGVYDRFRDRIMFPLRDAHGTVVGFTGRQLKEDKEAGGKYVNTPETLLYHKGSVLFGFDQAKDAVRTVGFALLVEGQMDVIGLRQHGFGNAVAVSGTALTSDQLLLLKRVTDTLALCFDADPGGSSASSRGIELAWQAGFGVQVVVLPEGEAKDPDELVRKDKAAFARALEARMPILEYLFTRARRAHPGQGVEDKKAVAKALLPALARLADPIERDHYLKRMSEELSVAESALRDALVRAAPAPPRRAYSSPASSATPAAALSAFAPSARLLALLMTAPRLLQHTDALTAGEEMDEQSRPLYTAMVSWYSTRSHDNSTEALLRALAARVPEASRLIESLRALGELEYQGKSDHELLQEAASLAQRIKRRYLRQKFTALTRAITDAERELAHAGGQGDASHLAALTQEFNRLAASLHQLD